MRSFLFVLPASLLLLGSGAPSNEPGKGGGKGTPANKVVAAPAPPFDQLPGNWVDSVFKTLTAEERIAQLFMVAAYSNQSKAHEDKITRLVEQHKIGGLIFFQGGPDRQARLLNRYQDKAQVPLLVSMDAEWGLAMRLDSTIKYPRQMTLGAIQDEQLIYRMGEDIARQCKRLGVHVNLAPVVDVNVNPKNPVINSRSFGESRENVAEKALAYMRGMQDHQVLANAKHFPGHGDTDRDSHKTLPVINHSKHRIDSIELYPFKALIQEGLGSMMVAHLFIPQLDSTKNQASTLSKPIVTGLLKQELQFKGLVFTDALNMKGVSNFNQPGEADLKALLAGNDVLLFSADVPKAIAMIKGAVERGEISQEEIDQRCRKILAAKQWVGLDDYEPIDREGLYEDLNHAAYDITRRQLVEHSLTLLESRHGAIPLKRLDTLKIASVAIGAKEQNVFQKTLSDYTQVEHFKLGKNASAEEFRTLRALLKDFNLVVVSVHNTNQRPSRNFGISKRTREMVRTLMKEQRVVLDVFANPYSIPSFGDLSALEGLVVSYQDDALTQSYSAQLLFGGIAARGKLPVSVSARYPVGAGIQTEQVRFKYTVPEEVGIVSADLDRIEAIAQSGIDRQAYPGCQVLVAKEGKVIYQRSFGHFTYEEKIPVTNRSIYDLASITKIAGTLPAVMRLSDAGNVNIDRNLCDYLPDLVDTTEQYLNMNLREMLAHQARLLPWIPFYQKTLVKGQPRYDIYSLAPSKTYPHRVAENLYIHKDYPQTILSRIVDSPLRKKHGYKYSDLGYYFLKEIVERQTGQPLDAYMNQAFYAPLGMTTMTYRPLEKFPKERLVPTEYDLAFRKQQIQGDVHDPGAAMMGGVAGHAGLFSNANDLAKLMQLYLNGGTYGGEQLLTQATIDDFSRCQFCDDDNRRGAGFDKPTAPGESGPTCDCVSGNSFGHSGFTGTITWADPDEEVIYVFLSNRVYPDARNKKLVEMNIRTNIMQVVYDAVNNAKAITRR